MKTSNGGMEGFRRTTAGFKGGGGRVNSTQRGDQTHNLLGVVGEVGFMLAHSGTVST